MVLLLFGAATSPVFAQTSSSEPPTLILRQDPVATGPHTPSARDSADRSRARIEAIWFDRKQALENGDNLRAQGLVEELRAYMRQEGITADRGIARGFAYEGYENLREGNYERAREAFDQARAIDPYLPEAQLGYAWSQLRSGRGVATFINEYAAGVKLLWKQFVTDEVQISNFAVVATIALFAGLMVFSLVVIARTQGRVRHDLFENSRRFLPEWAARVAAWALFLLPLLLWAGGVWLVLFWLVLSFRYMRVPEKTVAACVFLMIGLSPLGLAQVVDRFQASTDPETRVVVSAMQAGYNPETVRELRKVVSRHGDLAELHLLLGNAYARGDLLTEAYDEYKRVLDLNPSSPQAMINLGNVYFRLGEFSQAVQHYKKAQQTQPDLVAPQWNLYLAQTELLHFAEADTSLAMAREMDSERIGNLLARKKDGGDQVLLMQQEPSLSVIKRDLRSGGHMPATQANFLINPVSLASGIGLVFAMLLSIGGRFSLARACTRCGRSHCQRCRLDSRSNEYCARCVHLFIKKEGLTAQVRESSLALLDRRDRLTNLVRRVLSVGLPGAGQILAGRVGLGFTLMIGWVWTLCFLFLRQRLLQSPRVPVTDLPAPGLLLGVLLMATIWIAGNVTSSRREIPLEVEDGA